ncbi:hypothetical protein H8356DRAFT_1081056 [Neocallimastix lanati (nom. inval.)]|nr:hypothetical protein H8356DRAFT_1081056 [Neocallimastix sp. JGI-2020a]
MSFTAPWHNGNSNGPSNGMPMQNMSNVQNMQNIQNMGNMPNMPSMQNIMQNMTLPGMPLQPPMNFMKMNQFNQGIFMPPSNSNNFTSSNQPIPSMNPSQNSIGMAIEQFNNFTNTNGNEFMDILEAITKDCSQSNIKKGTRWFFDHCNSPIFVEQLGPLLITYTQSKMIFKEKLHITYLINDVLFHRYINFNLKFIKY